MLGPSHPQTLLFQQNLSSVLVNLGRSGEAVRQLRQAEPQLLAWLGREIHSTESEQVRRLLAANQGTFQDLVLTLALREQTPEAVALAGTVMLRWKQLQGEEEAYLARLVRRSLDPRIVALGHEVATVDAAERDGLTPFGRDVPLAIVLYSEAEGRRFEQEVAEWRAIGIGCFGDDFIGQMR